MARSNVQQTGDDQLVYGMPKRMVGSVQIGSSSTSNSNKAGDDLKSYWTVHPKPAACDKCQAMAGIIFTEKPERPHPNCKCEMKKHAGKVGGLVDCSHLVDISLPGIGATLLDKDFAQRVRAWRALNRQSDINLTFSSGFRTTSRQGKLGKDPNAKTPAKAGTSLHEAGRAVDVNGSSKYMKTGLMDQIVDNARAAGISWGGTFSDYRHFYLEVPGGRSNRGKYIQRAQECARQVL